MQWTCELTMSTTFISTWQSGAHFVPQCPSNAYWCQSICLHFWREVFVGESTTGSTRTRLPVREGVYRRPRYNISEGQLQYFVDFGFKAKEIAAMLGVSEATVRRRFQENGLSTSGGFSPLFDEEMDGLVRDIKQDFPQSGYRMVLGILRARGFRFQQHCVMECLRRVDLEGIIMRPLQLRVLHRRKYKVYGPNTLWHIDTNHKRIRSVRNTWFSTYPLNTRERGSSNIFFTTPAERQ